MFLSFLFATNEELGYDPTVLRNCERDFTYEVPQQNRPSIFYRTVCPIYERYSRSQDPCMARCPSLRSRFSNTGIAICSQGRMDRAGGHPGEGNPNCDL